MLGCPAAGTSRVRDWPQGPSWAGRDPCLAWAVAGEAGGGQDLGSLTSSTRVWTQVPKPFPPEFGFLFGKDVQKEQEGPSACTEAAGLIPGGLVFVQDHGGWHVQPRGVGCRRVGSGCGGLRGCAGEQTLVALLCFSVSPGSLCGLGRWDTTDLRLEGPVPLPRLYKLCALGHEPFKF